MTDLTNSDPDTNRVSKTNHDSTNSMAAVATQGVTAAARPNFKPIIEHAAAQKQAIAVEFDPKKHLVSTAHPEAILMKDIGYPEDAGVSPLAVSLPFQLFSGEAIEQMRSEIFKPEVMQNCSFNSNIAACQLRGYASKHAPFTYAAWTHAETVNLISKIAGVDLVLQGEYEIGHINFSVKTDEQTKEELAAINRQKSLIASDEGISGCPWEDDKPVVGWHTDSYPLVCVLMMSDCEDMIGGETALRTAEGEIVRVRGPQQGCAVILQGRYILHQALRALGSKERITAVTSFRPRSPFLKDDTVLTTVRPISDLSELYYDFAEYRLEIMEARLGKEREDMMARRREGKKFKTSEHKKFLQGAIGFLEHTNNEIVQDEKVIPGFIEEAGFPDVENTGTKDGHTWKRTRVDDTATEGGHASKCARVEED